MVKKTTIAKTAAGFGAAVASVYAAPELSADVVGLTFTPSSAPWTSSSTLRNIGIQSTGGGAVGSFSQWNDSIGKSFSFNGGFASWAIASAGQVLNNSDFAGVSSGFYYSTAATGTIYFGFRATAANGGGVGWFAVNLGGSQGDIVYNPGSDGQFGNAGESVIVGQGSAIPEPGSAGLALLALGAVGLRRRRRESVN